MGSAFSFAIPDLKIAEDDLISILSADRARNTLVLRVIAGLDLPDRGQVLYSGIPQHQRTRGNSFVLLVSSAESPRRGKKLMDQLLSQVTIGRRLSNIASRVRVNLVAKHLGLVSFLDDDTYYCNEDALVRIALACAFVREVKVIVLDDILTSLTESSKRLVRSAIAALQFELRKTVIFSTTNPADSLSVSKQIVVMNSGNVEQIGSPSDVYFYPANWFVASFVGYPKMNAFLISELNFDGEATYVNLSIGCRISLTISETIAAQHPCFLGVRPEALHIGDAIPVLVESVEYYESRTIVNVLTLTRKLRLAFVEEGFQHHERGDRLTLSIDTRQIYFFDASLKLVSPNLRGDT